MSLNFNWDANRDPNNKLLLTANYKKLSNYNYMADLIVSYPGRTVKGDYTFLLQSRYIGMNTYIHIHIKLSEFSRNLLHNKMVIVISKIALFSSI